MLIIFNFQQLMARLQAGLETTEVADSMISIVEVVMSLVNIYPETFPKHFTVSMPFPLLI